MSPWSSSVLLQFLKNFLFLVNFTVLRSTGWIFCKLPLNLGFSDLFLTVRPKLWVFGRKTAKVKAIFLTSYMFMLSCFSHETYSMISLGLPTVTWLFAPFHSLHFGSNSQKQPICKGEGGEAPPPQGGSIYILLGILCRKICFFSFIYSYQYGLMDVNFCIVFIIQCYVIYFITQIVAILVI